MSAKSPAAIRSRRGKYEAPTSSAAVSLFLDSLVLAYDSLDKDIAKTVNMELSFFSSSSSSSPFFALTIVLTGMAHHPRKL